MDCRETSVDVISVCTAAGEIRPLRMQLIDEEKQLLRVNIEEIVKTEEITHVGAEATVFTCRATVWDRKWLFELRYVFRSHSWSILRRFH